MNSFTIFAVGLASVACSSAACAGTANSANYSPSNPVNTPLVYAGPDKASNHMLSTAFNSKNYKRENLAYQLEREALLNKYISLEAANGGQLSDDARQTMAVEIKQLKEKYGIS